MKTCSLHRTRFGQLTELIISQTFCFQLLISMFSLLPFPYKLINLINSEQEFGVQLVNFSISIQECPYIKAILILRESFYRLKSSYEATFKS